MSEERPTRTRILDMLKGEPPQPVRTLSAALAITPMAVRQHLVTLERDGLVRRASRRRPLGRPESVYELTAAARVHYPDHHDSLACELLESVRDRLGAAGLESVLADLLERRLARGRERVQAKTTAARLTQLTALQDEAGYMATCDPVRGEIVQRHCTVCSAAEEFPALCALEQRLFEGLLGAPMERVEHVLQGDAACRYRLLGGPPAVARVASNSDAATTKSRRANAGRSRPDVAVIAKPARAGARKRSVATRKEASP